MMVFWKLCLFLILSWFLGISLADSSPQFGLPIDCNLGKDCYIMHYLDRDPSANAIDYGCGRQTYDRHQGTDFGIANWQVMEDGIAVKAIASGVILRVRDGVRDKLVLNEIDKKAVSHQECGNGIVIDHGNGWESQYCHLKQQSIVVKAGMSVEKGAILGMVGASGLASFPHVHLSLRYQGQIIDPFVGINSMAGCKVKRNPLWDRHLDYVPTGLIEAGFAPEIPTQKDLWQGKYHRLSLDVQAPVLIFWIHAYGIRSGDVESFKLTAPDGQAIVNQEKTLTKSSRSWMSYVGKRHRVNLKKGIWQGKYQLKRGNQIIIDIQRQIEID
jgi:murein DD-endopeptidase MepM/ murein hydrolase activator NlpD